MSISFSYDTSYPGPAFPVVVLSIAGRRPEPVHAVTGLVDSGADATLVPLSLLKQINARRVDVAWARTVTGERYSVNLYRVTLFLGGEVLHGIEVIANERVDEVIVGRDVLNQLYVTLDGPGETVRIGY